MHPAFSVILFTTLSGTGCGMLVWIGLAATVNGYVDDRNLHALPPFVLALVLVTAGLLSSLAHLGKPLRAWRAFSQWRTSWLSREGLIAMLLVAATVWLASFALQEATPLWMPAVSGIPPEVAVNFPARLAGALVLALALATTVCTAMIYASLPPIPAWRDWLVVPAYLLYSLSGGLVWSAAIESFPRFHGSAIVSGLIVGLMTVTALVKLRYWRRIDRAVALPSTAAAIGLPDIGHVRSFERPHTEANYLLREMGYVVARRHAARLRVIAIVVGLLLPALLGMVASFVTWGATVLAVLAALLFQLGALVERWLFFAQARHTITSYYGVENNA